MGPPGPMRGEVTLAERVVEVRGRGRGSGGAAPLWRWAPVAAAVLLALGALAVAETVWLPRGLPRSHAAQTRLVAYLEPGAPEGVPTPGEAVAWGEALARRATAPQVVAAVARRLGREDQEADGLVSALAAHPQCVDLWLADGREARGVPLALTVRGDDRAEVQAAAQAWAAEAVPFLRQGTPRLEVAPVDAIPVLYQPCQGE